MNLNLGQIRKARELGRKGHCQYVWHACALCGRPRWTELERGGPRHTICAVCAGRTYRKKKEQLTQGHTCPPHFWFVDSVDLGQCKYCGELKDFRELSRKSKDKNLNNKAGQALKTSVSLSQRIG